MERGRQPRMPREALIIIGDILREAEDLSEALYNTRSKFFFQMPAVLQIGKCILVSKTWYWGELEFSPH